MLSIALLSACGSDTIVGEDHHIGFLTPPASQDGKDEEKKGTPPKQIDRTDPAINRFLTEGQDGIGQQLSPTVVSVDNNGNGKIDNTDRIAYDQPGIVSEICAKSKCKGIVEEKNNNNNNNNNNSTDDKTDPMMMLDVNSIYHNMLVSGTIDGNANIPKDAGISKITRKRVNGELQDYGGSIGREFNEVILFANPTLVRNKQQYLSSYFRSPAAAGWSYQTFGNFFGGANGDYLKNRRDVILGYQSIGRPTKISEMPTADGADYTGITHAYYNSAQVTAHNKIHADFGARNLSYETTDTSVLHQFGAFGHVIEDRPDLNLSGSAAWDDKTADFTGKMKAANGLEGEMKGRFYGPAAEEVGGVYGLHGQDTNGEAVHYIGGFGGRR
jgi:hypothetical protein